MTSPVICALAEDDDVQLAQEAARLAEGLKAPLVLAHAVPLPPLADAAAIPVPMGYIPPVGPPPLVDDDERRASEQHRHADARERLRELAHDVGAEQALPRVLDGPAVPDQLRSLAEELGAQLMVIGSRGHGATRAALLGSTSHDLAARSPCPVMIVSPDARARLESRRR